MINLAKRSIRAGRAGVLAFVACGVATSLRGQEFAVSGGVLAPAHMGESSYSWQIDYRQEVSRHFAASAAWINEGHLAGHHRDGTAWQGWANFPLWRDRVALSVGAGAYFYFDTQSRAGGTAADVHGVSPIFSASAAFHVSERGFIRLTANRISPAQDTKVNTAAIGVGWWLGQTPRPPLPGRPPAAQSEATGKEFTVFVGESVVNSFFSENALAASLEFRRGIASHLDWSASYLNEGDPRVIHRNGFATQLWPAAHFFGGKIALGFGIGPYLYFESRRDSTGGKPKPGVAPLLSPTLSVELKGKWLLRFVWDRVVSDYDRDSDVFLVGLGRRWR